MNAKRAKHLRHATGFRPAATRTYKTDSRGTTRIPTTEPRAFYQAYKSAIKAAKFKGLEA